MRWERKTFQTKEQRKTPEEKLSEEIDSLPDKEFKVMIVKMIKELERRMDEQSEKSEVYNKELENIKNKIEVKNTIIEMKNNTRRNQQ